MDYEEQLSAAKFRAERDMARQELERGAQDAENRRVELCAMLGVDPGTGWSDAMECMRRRLMPEDMEWLRYDTGEPVPLGGEVKVTVHDEDGDFDRTFAIRSIKYKENGVLLEGTGNEMVILSIGERVKRPKPDPIGADGLPIKVGDEVWDAVTGAGTFTVKETDLDAVWCGEYVYGENGCKMYRIANQLTHTKPEQDSWEKVEKDILIGPCDYFGFPGLDDPCCECPAYGSGCHAAKEKDLVRRCKALAGASE